MSPSEKAQTRERWHRQAERLNRLAEQYEREGESLEKITGNAPGALRLRERGRWCIRYAAMIRENVRAALVIVTSLTDYRDALDKPSPRLLAKLEELRAEVFKHDLTPANYRYPEPNGRKRPDLMPWARPSPRKTA